MGIGDVVRGHHRHPTPVFPHPSEMARKLETQMKDAVLLSHCRLVLAGALLPSIVARGRTLGPQPTGPKMQVLHHEGPGFVGTKEGAC